MELMTDKPKQGVRLLSLDFFRGITMFLLMAESTGLYWVLTQDPIEGTYWYNLFIQFHHHPWHGFHFWDLIQPFFMFIVGVAMPFSIQNRMFKGDSKRTITWHIVKRSLLLLLFGVLLHCGFNKKLVWELWNVLSQLSITILIAYILMRYPARFQILISVGLLVATDLIYRYFWIEGYNHPFIMGENFGSWMDRLLMGKINGDGWVAINCIPTAAHTIWGVEVGQLLLKTLDERRKFKIILFAGIAILLIGYSLNFAGVTPIIKRISTSSFVLVSGGWALIVLALSYWLIDIKGFKNWIFTFVVVGTNSIFIYLFFESVGGQWLNGFVAIFSKGILNWTGASSFIINLITSLAVLSIEWYLCYWLYKRKIFFKI